MTVLARQPLPGTTVDPLYPDSDGRPMGETDYHSFAQILLREALQDFFADRSDAYVATNILFYYERGNPKGRRDPDVLVASGVAGKHFRRSYRLWEEGVPPCVLFEIASKKTWKTDVGEKRELYARLGVREYFVFDAEGKCLKPVFRGFRLEDGVSVEMTPDADGGLTSAELGLRMVPEGAMLRLIDLKTGKPIPTRGERIEQEKARAEDEKRRAKEEKRRAKEEKRRADELAAEVERLRALLERDRNGEEGPAQG